MKSMLILCCLLLFTVSVSAEVYKWVDDKGQVHYEDHPKNSHEEKIATDGSTAGKLDTREAEQRKTEKLLKQMEKSRKSRQKQRHKKLAKQQKQDEKCLKKRNKIRKLEARMKHNYSEFSNDRPDSYQRLEAEVADRKKYYDKYCH
jgi:hypothetical protein